VYPGIDAVFYWRAGRLEYDLIAAAGADLTRVRIAWIGPDVKLDDSGAISIAGGEIRQIAPVITQDKDRVAGRFVSVGAGQFRLEIGTYDRARPIIVDPLIVSSVFVGGENDDRVTVVREGFVAGTTASVSLPGTVPGRRRRREVFVQGTGAVGITGNVQFVGTVILGGAGDEEVAGAFFNSARQVVLAGTTSSSDLAGSTVPLRGGTDGFLCTLLSDGRSVIPPSCQLVGGSGEDRIHTLSVLLGFNYVYAGETTSPDLPGARGSYKGGVDGFFGANFLPSLHYLGGSGDDRILAAAAVGTNPTQVFLAGETTSQDFDYVPSGSPPLQGPSDGFITVATYARLSAPVPQPEFSSQLVGGTGEDRITSISASVGGPRTYFFIENSPIVAIAGTTNSTDLPVRDAAQPELAGESDAFLGVMSGGKFEWLSYLGGSGADEAAAVERNWAGDLFVTGSTRSKDLKTVLAVQDTSGGGEDAFYGVVGKGVVRTLTYYGGSGDDRASSLALVREATARIGGWSNSSDAPIAVDSDPVRGKGFDGFYVEMGSSYLFALREVHLAKDGALFIPVTAALARTSLPITYRSSDGSKVRITDGTVSGAEITAPYGSQIFFEGFGDSGTVEVTASAEGFAPAKISVKLYPGMAYVPTTTGDLTIGNTSSGAWLWWVPVDPASGGPLEVAAPTVRSTTPRTGFRLPPVMWTSSNEQAIALDSPSTNAGDYVRFTLRGPGESRVRATIEGVPVWPPDGVVFRVNAPSISVVPSMTVGMNLQAGLRFFLLPASFAQTRRTTLVVRSGDPTKLLLSADSATPGAETLSLSTGSFLPFGIVLQALSGEGEVPVTLSLPEFGVEAVTTVRLEPSRMRWGFQSGFGRGLEEALTATTGESRQATFLFEGTSGSTSLGLRAGLTPPVLRFTSGNGELAEISRVSVRPLVDTLTVTTLAEGTSTLDVSFDEPLPFELVNRSVPVTITRRGARLDSIPPPTLLVGKDLQTAVRFRSSQSGTPLSVVSEDGSAVAVSASPTQAGTASLSLAFQANGEYQFYVQGLRESGETDVVVKYEGGEARTRVTLLPSGLGLTDAAALELGRRAVRVGLFAVDDVSGLPVQTQTPGPGQRVTVAIRAEGSAATVSSASLVLDTSNAVGEFTFPAPGPGAETTVVAEAASWRSATTTIRGARNRFLGSRTALVMEDTIVRQSFDFAPRAGASARITSSNPEAVLVSRSASETGTASLTLNQLFSRVEFVLHGIKAGGQSTIAIESEGFEPFQIAVTVVPLHVTMDINSSTPFSPVSMFQGQGVSGSLRLSSGELRPGAAPIRYTLRTSDPNVATVAPAEVVIGASGHSTGFGISGKSAGFADLLAESERVPAGRFARAIAVRAPSAAPAAREEIYLPSNLQRNVAIVPWPGNNSGVIATVTSSDPSRVAVSRNDSVLGGASTTIAVQAGSAGPFFIQSMGIAGQAEITARAAGFPEQRWLVRVVPSWFVASIDTRDLPVGGSVSGSVFIRAEDPNWAQFQPRPDLGPQRVRLTNSDPTVAELTQSEVTITERSGPAPISVRAKAAGTTRIGVEQPPGFGPAPDSGSVLRVVRPTIGTPCPIGFVLARDTQRTCPLNVPVGTTLDVVSSDPQRLVVATSTTAAGSGRQTVTTSASSLLTFQALASSGTVEVLISAPGFEPLRIPIVLRRAVVQADPFSSPLRRGEMRDLRLHLYSPLIGGSGGQQLEARAGTSIQVGVSATPAGIVSFESPSARFEPGVIGATVRLRAEAAGAAVLRLSVPEGVIDGTTVPVSFVVQ
jgi:hypothetical protein